MHPGTNIVPGGVHYHRCVKEKQAHKKNAALSGPRPLWERWNDRVDRRPMLFGIERRPPQ